MSRHIKFRAWDSTSGFPHRMITEIGMGTVEQPMGINECIRRYIEDPNWIIEQFIGLLDKHGNEIYEGDIVRRSTGYIFEVKIREYSIGPSSVVGYNVIPEQDEIIGNVHQNPELF